MRSVRAGHGRSRRGGRVAAAVLGLALALPPADVAGPAGAGKAEPARSFKGCNVVLVSFDALQAAHVHSLGYPREITPALDEMAAAGYAFTNAVSVSSWTVPASMSWFTGVYPSEHKVRNKFAVYEPPVQKIARLKELAPELATLAEILKGNGYATAGFTGDAGVSGVFGFSQGFDTYVDKVKFGDFGQSLPAALSWLAEHRGERFFLFLHGYDAHGQNVPAEGLDYRYVEPGYDRRYTGAKEEQEALREEGLEKGSVGLRAEDVRFWRAVYDEKISRADARFRTFLEEFARLGLLDRTIFVLTSDHGTEFHEHGRFDHGFSLYDELIRVPLVVRLPGPPAGRTIGEQVSSLDVMPTILDLLEVEVPAATRTRLRGVSLAPALRGEPVGRDVYSETDYRLYTFKRSVRTADGWKFILTLEDGARELYNLRDDPGETRNLAAAEPRRAYELEQRLFAHFASLGDDLGAPRTTGLSPVYDSQARPASGK